MSVRFIERKDLSDDSDLTILMTLTSTYTLTSKTSDLFSETSSLFTSSDYILSNSATSSKSTKKTLSKLSTLSHTSSTTSIESSNTYSTSTKTSVTSNTAASIDGYISGSSGMSSSLKLGLTIGLPIACIFLVSAIILVWFFCLKKKKKSFTKNKKTILPFENDFFEFVDHGRSSKNNNSQDMSDHDDQTLTERKDSNSANNTLNQSISGNWLSNFVNGNQSKVKKDIELDQLSISADNNRLESQTVPQRATQSQTILNRLSTLINPAKVNLNSVTTPLSTNFKSPMFLRKFHLHNSPAGSPTFRNNSTITNSPPIRKNHNKNLPKLPLIINTYTNSNSLKDFENTVIQQKIPVKYENKSEIENDNGYGNGNGNEGIRRTLDPFLPSNVSTCIVERNYFKKLTDELTVYIGDKVKIDKKFSDGWCLVTLTYVTTNKNKIGQQGMIPSLCVKKNK